MNKRGSCNLKHITHDHKKSGLEDFKVLAWAGKENRVLITHDKFFLKQRSIQKKTAVVKISGGAMAQEIDERLMKLVKKFPNQEDYLGRVITITSRDIHVLDYKGNDDRLIY